jgi:hypothetical protein
MQTFQPSEEHCIPHDQQFAPKPFGMNPYSILDRTHALVDVKYQREVNFAL